MENKQLNNLQRWCLCEVCDIKNSPDKNTWYTREELVAHMKENHAGWAFCKGCNELIWKREYDEGKGWCSFCVYACLDCMDREKYPEEI